MRPKIAERFPSLFTELLPCAILKLSTLPEPVFQGAGNSSKGESVLVPGLWTKGERRGKGGDSLVSVGTMDTISGNTKKTGGNMIRSPETGFEDYWIR